MHRTTKSGFLHWLLHNLNKFLALIRFWGNGHMLHNLVRHSTRTIVDFSWVPIYEHVIRPDPQNGDALSWYGFQFWLLPQTLLPHHDSDQTQFENTSSPAQTHQTTHIPAPLPFKPHLHPSLTRIYKPSIHHLTLLPSTYHFSTIPKS